MSGDTQSPGERLWHVKEQTGTGYNRRQHGITRAIYGRDRAHAREQFIASGYKRLERSRLTAVSEGGSLWP